MTVNTNHVAEHQTDPRRLWERWIALWNGDLSVADEAVTPGVVVHRPGTVPLRGRVALVEWVRAVRGAAPETRLRTEVGPIVTTALVAGRWVAADRTGRPLEATGTGSTDIVRVEGGRIVECWVGHDGRLLPGQVRCLAAAG